MSIDLQEFIAGLPCAQKSHVLRDALEGGYSEAQRVMSPNGLKTYLDGVTALCNMGKGEDVIVSFLEEMPEVVREIGEEAVGESVYTVLKLSSQTSGAVLALLFASLPTAARRLGDIAVYKGYLNLIERMVALAPRGLRPMLDHVDELLSKLTLGGLRRWVMYGAETYKRDFKGQIAYFSLESSDAMSVMQRERRGILFIDAQRKLQMYLRAFWNREFYLRPTAGDYESKEGYKPYIEKGAIFVPDAYDDYSSDFPSSQATKGKGEGAAGMEVYRAAAAHAASHIVYTAAAIQADNLNPIQRLVVSVFEDARIEELAIRDFPGLRQLWLSLHPMPDAAHAPSTMDEFIHDLLCLSRGLLDPSYDPGVERRRQWIARFHEEMSKRPDDNQLAWDLGVTYCGQAMQAIPARVSSATMAGLPVVYRDDNRFIWEFAELDWEGDGKDYTPASQRAQRRHVGLMEFVDAIDSEMTGPMEDDGEILVLSTELFPYEDNGVSYNQMEGKEPILGPFHYHEWDYQVQVHRPDWTTVYERRLPRGDKDEIDRILREHKGVAARLRHIIDMLQPRGLVIERKQAEGDDLDLDAAVRSMVDYRMGITPDDRVHLRRIQKVRDVAVMVLMDLSQSTNDYVRGSEKSVLQLTKEATTLLAWAIDGIGDRFAVHGFASDSRHDVQYYRFKDFFEPWDDNAQSRLAGMSGQLSTRMGAALRHAGRHLAKQQAAKKLMLVITDGEPADVDVDDPQHLRFDTKNAVEELKSNGVMTYCITLDPHADAYVSRIFGDKQFTVIDNVQRLPEKLPQLFASLTK